MTIPLDKIAAFLSNPAIVAASQNTKTAVSLETGMKAVGRPMFTLADKHADEKAKKYSATKEFLYQVSCLAIYTAIVIPVFKEGGFKLLGKMFKDDKGFKLFKDSKTYSEYLDIASKPLAKRAEQKKYDELCKSEEIKKLLSEENPEKFHLLKGSVEFASIIGSITGLTILAPWLSHFLVHPAMELLGLEGKNAAKSEVSAAEKPSSEKPALDKTV